MILLNFNKEWLKGASVSDWNKDFDPCAYKWYIQDGRWHDNKEWVDIYALNAPHGEWFRIGRCRIKLDDISNLYDSDLSVKDDNYGYDENGVWIFKERNVYTSKVKQYLVKQKATFNENVHFEIGQMVSMKKVISDVNVSFKTITYIGYFGWDGACNGWDFSFDIKSDSNHFNDVFVEIDDMNNRNNEMNGWVCPKCGRVNAPFVDHCNCTDGVIPTFGITSVPPEIIIPGPCKSCPTHPSNGGTGNCNCMNLGTFKI